MPHFPYLPRSGLIYFIITIGPKTKSGDYKNMLLSGN